MYDSALSVPSSRPPRLKKLKKLHSNHSEDDGPICVVPPDTHQLADFVQ